MVFEEQPANWPPGRPVVPQSFVDEHKRERCALALSEVVAKVGARDLTVSLLTSRAQVARGTFYGLFDGLDDAFRFACELGNRRLREAVEGGAELNCSWEERVELALEALLAAAAAKPALAELCLVHSWGRIELANGPYDPELVKTLTALLEQGRAGYSLAAEDRLTENLLAHGILSVLAGWLRKGEAERLGELGPQLTEISTQLLR